MPETDAGTEKTVGNKVSLNTDISPRVINCNIYNCIQACKISIFISVKHLKKGYIVKLELKVWANTFSMQTFF